MDHLEQPQTPAHPRIRRPLLGAAQVLYRSGTDRPARTRRLRLLELPR